jgi:hypothetical protein
MDTNFRSSEMVRLSNYFLSQLRGRIYLNRYMYFQREEVNGYCLTPCELYQRESILHFEKKTIVVFVLDLHVGICKV